MPLDSVRWRKSSYSDERDCVEVAYVQGMTAVRDSKNTEGGLLLLPRVDWRHLIQN